MQHRKKTLSRHLFRGSSWALFTMFVWELVEEGCESLIAFCVSEVVSMFIVKALSALAIIGATQGIKVCIKRFLVPFIKTLTYKEGKDKMSKIKKFFTWLWCNKKTLLGTVATAVAGLSATNVIHADKLPCISVKGFNITPFVYYACLAVLTLLGVFGVGLEKIEEFFNRVGLIKIKKEEKAIWKEAKKELLAEEKKASQTNAELEKANAKALAEAQAKEKHDQEEAEYRAKVELAKAKLLAEQNKKE